MRTISTSLFMSLDAVIEADDDWQFPFLDDETFGALTQDWGRSDAALLGRKSFEGFADVRHNAPDSPVVGFLESVERYVVTSSRDYEPGWPGTETIGTDEIRPLKHRSGGNILVIGSVGLLGWLLSADLVDDLAITLLPVIVGSGPRFTTGAGAGPARLSLALTESQQLGNGAMHLTYARSGTT